jgi:hypothetical protein
VNAPEAPPEETPEKDHAAIGEHGWVPLELEAGRFVSALELAQEWCAPAG